jgi:hypothetical protein
MSDRTRDKLKLHTKLERIMADKRFEDGRSKGPELRALLIAYFWCQFDFSDRDARWQRTLELCGLTNERSGKPQLRELFRADAPRFEPWDRDAWRRIGCEMILIRGPRTGDKCGKNATCSFRVTEPDTGEWAIKGWCTNHSIEGDRVYRLERAQTFPEPLPNTGGLLPCYLKASNWPDIYTAASYGWKPPAIGIVADDWPTLRKVWVQLAPQLTALDGDGEDSDLPVPSLRLVMS